MWHINIVKLKKHYLPYLIQQTSIRTKAHFRMNTDVHTHSHAREHTDTHARRQIKTLCTWRMHLLPRNEYIYLIISVM